MDKIDLQIKLDGKSFEVTKKSLSVDLGLFAQTITNMNAIILGSYATKIGKKRLSKNQKNDLKLTAHKFSQGSLIIETCLEVTPLVATLFPILPKDIFEITCYAMELGKILRTWLHNEEPYQVLSNSGENNQIANPVVTVGDNSTANIFIINTATGESLATTREIMNATMLSSASQTRIMNQLDEEGLKEIEIKRKNNDTCSFKASVDNKYLYNKKNIADEKVLSFEVKIIELNREFFGGMLRFRENVEILSSVFSFSIVNRSDFDLYLIALDSEYSLIKAWVEREPQIDGSSKISHLNIIGIENFN